MKRFSSILIVLCLILSFAGCSSAPKPDETVKGFMDSSKNLDFTKMATFVNPNNTKDLNSVQSKINDDPTQKYFVDYIKTRNSKMTYEVKASNVSGDSASVSVYCKYIDSTPLLKAVFSEFLIEAMSLAFSGTELTDEQTGTMMKKIMDEKQKSITDTFKESTIDIKCVKINDKWYIDSINDDLFNVITANIISAGKEIASSFSGASSSGEIKK